MNYITFNSQGSSLAAKVIERYVSDFDYNGQKVQASKEEAKILAEIPGGQKILIDESATASITELEFNKEISDLVFSLAKIHGVKIMTEEQLKLEIAKVQKEVEDLNKAAKVSEQQIKDLVEAKEKAEKDKNQMEDEVKMMKRKEMAAERFAAIASIHEDAVSFINSDSTKAKEDLSEMSDAEFARTVNLVTSAFKKLTEVTKAAQPKLTDQTVTNNTKTTDVVTASDVALSSAKIESDGDFTDNLASASTAESNENSCVASLQEYARSILKVGKK